MTLWVTGGEQRARFRKRLGWDGFETALVVRVTDAGPERVLEYHPRPDHRPEDDASSHVFTAATFTDTTAYLCTPTEVVVCRLPDFQVQRVISHPCFNDLHHVALAPSGLLYVVVTGLDAVAELTPDGELLRLVDVLGGAVWDRFSRDRDYRRVPSTKPHRSHPNYVFFLDGRPWVTRFAQRDAVPIDGGPGRFDVGGAGAHDGHVTAGQVCFTTVDGHFVVFDRTSGERRDLDLNALSADATLGWCRGVLPLGDEAWVGFTRIRFTKLRQNLAWMKIRASDVVPRPTRISLYDVVTPRLIREVDLEGAGLHAVFSIHAAGGGA